MKDTWKRPVFRIMPGGKPVNMSKSVIGKPHYIDMWYDRSIKMWTLLVKDKNDFQIGNAIYEGIKENALAHKKELEEKYGIKPKRVKK